jgi:hypothetical protein
MYRLARAAHEVQLHAACRVLVVERPPPCDPRVAQQREVRLIYTVVLFYNYSIPLAKLQYMVFPRCAFISSLVDWMTFLPPIYQICAGARERTFDLHPGPQLLADAPHRSLAHEAAPRHRPRLSEARGTLQAGGSHTEICRSTIFDISFRWIWRLMLTPPSSDMYQYWM